VAWLHQVWAASDFIGLCHLAEKEGILFLSFLTNPLSVVVDDLRLRLRLRLCLLST
jgi:hypothetical protein